MVAPDLYTYTVTPSKSLNPPVSAKTALHHSSLFAAVTAGRGDPVMFAHEVVHKLAAIVRLVTDTVEAPADIVTEPCAAFTVSAT